MVDEVYRLSKLMPKTEIYILISQMLRAAISIPSNIAEGFKRNHRPEFIHFLGIANASAGELQTQLLIAAKSYPEISFTKALGLVTEIEKMLHTMLAKMRQNNP